MLPITRRSGERVYLFIEGIEQPIHITPMLLDNHIPTGTKITLNISAPSCVRISREEHITHPICDAIENKKLTHKE